MTPRKKPRVDVEETKDEAAKAAESGGKSDVPTGSYTTEATHEVSVITERIYAGLVQELATQGFNNPPEVAHTILKNGFNIALSSMHIMAENHQGSASNPIGFRS